jgi:hypothetical protein
MRTLAWLTWLTSLFRLRWAPAIALTLASIAFAFFAIELAPRAPMKNAAAHNRPTRPTAASRDPRFDEPARATAPPYAAREPLPSSPPSDALERAGAIPNIVSFFPPPPMTLPPPLDEEEPAPVPHSP